MVVTNVTVFDAPPQLGLNHEHGRQKQSRQTAHRLFDVRGVGVRRSTTSRNRLTKKQS